MSTINESENEEFDSEAGEMDKGVACGRAREASEPRNRDSVSNESESGQPPAPLQTPGQIKAAYESGVIGLEVLSANVIAGLTAMKPVVLTDAVGTGKDRVTTQRIEYVPDYDTRLRWQDHLTHTVEGMPIKRQEIVSRKVTTDEDLITQAKQSPAFARSLKHMLEKIIDIADDHHAKKGGALKPAAKPLEH